jgi:hypothetical protein
VLGRFPDHASDRSRAAEVIEYAINACHSRTVPNVARMSTRIVQDVSVTTRT